MLTNSALWTCVAIFCLTVVWAQDSTLSETTWPDQAQELLSAAEFHFDNYRRSIQELQSTLDKVPIDQLNKVLNKRSRISKRSEAGQLFNSFLAFCEKLKNDPNTEPNVTSRHPMQTTPPGDTLPVQSGMQTTPPGDTLPVQPVIWRVPEITFQPLTLRVQRRRQTMMVVMTVTHRVPLMAYAHLSPYFSVRPSFTYLDTHSNSQLKESKVRFWIWLTCSKKDKHRNQVLQLMVTEKKEQGSTSSVNIIPCNAVKFYGKWKEYKIHFNHFNWTLSSNILINQSGRKTSFGVKLVNDTSIDFGISTTEFNKDLDKLGTSQKWISERFEPLHGCRLQSANMLEWEKFNGHAPSSLVAVKVCSQQSENSSVVRDRYVTSRSSLNITLYVDTYSSNTGVIDVGQSFRPESGGNSLIRSSNYYRRVIVTDEPSKNPIPTDKVSFFGEKKFLCDTNPLTARTDFCGVGCHVSARDVSKLEIIRAKDLTDPRSHEVIRSDKNNSVKSQVLPIVGIAHTFLTFNTIDKGNEGKYICRVTLKSGLTHDREVDLLVAGLPHINPDHFNMSVSQGYATVKCQATGSNITLTVDIPGNYSAQNKNKVSIRRPSANDVIYTARVPVALLYDKTYLHCSASNQLAKTTERLDIRGRLPHYENTSHASPSPYWY